MSYFDGQLTPVVKWPGGKRGELGHIHASFPKDVERVFEPFVGGGAVFLSCPNLPAVINDKSFDLINLYRHIARGDDSYFSSLRALDSAWARLAAYMDERQGFILRCVRRPQLWPTFTLYLAQVVVREIGQLTSLLGGVRVGPLVQEGQKVLRAKLIRMGQLEQKHGKLCPEDVVSTVEGALKSVLYLTVRTAYNTQASVEPSSRAALFYFLREYCYAAMFRFNRKGEFNVPYGGISYNRKYMSRKIEGMRSLPTQQVFARATLCNLDFEQFLISNPPSARDFVFFDPPYDSEFSAYDQATFGESDQRRLRAVVEGLRGVCSLMLVVKNTPLMSDLYGSGDFRVNYFDKTYMWTIKERNDRQAQHMLITNY